jgi:hypothetical protein
LLWGLPGIGKTSIIEEVTRNAGMSLKVLSPGEQGEGAFGVIPMPVVTEDGEAKMSYPKPDWIDQFEDTEDRGVVFVDELTTAPPALQPALLGLIQAGRIGSAVLPKGIRILGAANPPEASAGGWDIAAPVANRLGHINWPAPDAMEWTQWLMAATAFSFGATANIAATIAEEDRVINEWDQSFAKAKGIFGAFVKARPELLFSMPKSGDPEMSRAWPSPRSWENACRAYTASLVHKCTPEARSLLVNAFIGQGAWMELSDFITKVDLPDPEGVLDGTIAWNFNPARIDQTFAVLTSCTACVVSTKDPKLQLKRGEVLWTMLEHIGTVLPDVVYLASIPMVQGNGIALSSQGGIRALAKLRPILQSAGIVA